MDEGWQRKEKPAAEAQERRRPRQSLLLQAELRLAPDLPPVEVRIRNLSTGGALVACRACPGLGDRVSIMIKGIGEVAGSVVRTTPTTVAITFDQAIDVAQAQTLPPKRKVEIYHHVANPKRPGLSTK